MMQMFFNFIIVIINTILLFIIFLQLRDVRKPLLTTKIIRHGKDVDDRPDVLESGTLYLIVTNESKNIARTIDIEYKFNFDGHSTLIKEKKLSHLNPKESVEIRIKREKIIKRYPDLFEGITEKDITKKIPKETLKGEILIKINYNPVLGFKYILEDNYVIEWGSRENYPDFEDHPIFNSWNKRNDYYIHKISDK